jgi:pimeloyl-ACP methyl ester carboxylesterase
VSIKKYRVVAGFDVVADVGGNPQQPAVILLHGGGQTRHSWGGAMEALLQRGYHVINLDARGHGESDWAPDGDYSLQGMTEDLRGVMATLGAPPVLVGASMGGATALYAVGKSPGVIARALVMVDVVPHVEPAGAERISTFMRANPLGFATLADAADAVATYNRHRSRPKDHSGLMKNLRLRGGRLHWHWDPRFIESRLRKPREFTDALLQACRGVQIPTLLVRGMRSDIVSNEGVGKFQRALPALEVFDVAEASHMVAGDRNDAFNEGVLTFLARHAPPGHGQRG